MCKRIFLALLLFFFSAVFASEQSIDRYMQWAKDHPSLMHPLGNASKGEIEIILDKKKMIQIEKQVGRDVGIIAQNKYWIWVNDACLFPKGALGIYGRIISQNASTKTTGVAVLPISSDGKVALNCNFRHATRSWEIELPRGGINPNESPNTAAIREVKEETGLVVDDLELLGAFPPDSGVCSSVIPVYKARVIDKKAARPEKTEAIDKVIFLSVEEIKSAFKKGSYPCEINGKVQEVPFRDPFLAYAVLIAE